MQEPVPEKKTQNEFLENVRHLLREFQSDIDSLKGKIAEIMRIGEKGMNAHNDKQFHNQFHAKRVEDNFHEYVDMLGLTEDETEQLKAIGTVLAWFHDIILDRDNGVGTPEEASGKRLKDEVRKSIPGLNEGFLDFLDQAIRSTTVSFKNGLEQFNIRDEKTASINPFALLLTAADLGHFALEDEEAFKEWNMRFGLEMSTFTDKKTGKEDFSDERFIMYFDAQIMTIDGYRYPENLPSTVKDELQRRKKINIARLNQYLIRDKIEFRVIVEQIRLSPENEVREKN